MKFSATLSVSHARIGGEQEADSNTIGDCGIAGGSRGWQGTPCQCLVADHVFVCKQQSTYAESTTSVNLGTAEDYTVLAKSAISNSGNSYIVGNVGLSPAAHTDITGFALTIQNNAYGEHGPPYFTDLR